jgi:hypothetical protein
MLPDGAISVPMSERGPVDTTGPRTERTMRLDRIDEAGWPSKRRVDADDVDLANGINERVVIEKPHDRRGAPGSGGASDPHGTCRLRFSSKVDAENIHPGHDGRGSVAPNAGTDDVTDADPNDTERHHRVGLSEVSTLGVVRRAPALIE